MPTTATPVPRVRKALSLEGELGASTNYWKAGAHPQGYRCLSFPVITLLVSIQYQTVLSQVVTPPVPVLYLMISRLYLPLTASSH